MAVHLKNRVRPMTNVIPGSLKVEQINYPIFTAIVLRGHLTGIILAQKSLKAISELPNISPGVNVVIYSDSE